MRFFKHFTDSHRGRSMQTVLDTLGHDGHSCWWILVEMCAEKLHKGEAELYSEEHCRFVFNERLVRSSLRLGRTKVARILHQFQTMALLSFQITGNEIQIDMPKLLECLDRDAKRARTERGPSAPKKKRKRKIKEEEKEFRAAADLISNLSDEIKKLYDEAYVIRESVKAWDWLENNPGRKPKLNKGFRRFFTNWLERGWEAYRKTIPTNAPTAKGSAGADWEQTASRVLKALVRHGTGSKATLAIEQELGPDLWRIVIRAGTSRIRSVQADGFQLRTIAQMLKLASDSMGGAA